MSINNHIIDNLNYYLENEAPEYAFLITGGWGAGKTHFIESFINDYNKKSNNRIIKISLFGFRTTSSIDEMIFQTLHPILGHKYTRLGGNILKGALKLGCKIDLDGDSKPDAEITASLEKINFRDMLSTNKDKGEIILALDDLERTDIPLKEILGYINYLVEISKVKLILIANENSIYSKDESHNNIYSKFKEKVIGKTFQVKHNLDEVMDDFLDKSRCEELKKHRDIIKEIYTCSEDINLRKLKQSIQDFEYIASYIDDKKIKNEDYSALLVRVFFALSSEIKNGKLKEEELRNNKPFISERSKNDGSNNIFYKYGISYRNLYSGDLWADILFKGDTSNLKIATDNLVYFKKNISNENPLWFKLWNFRDIDDDEQFNYLTKQLLLEFDSLQEEEYQIYLHKLALVIYFSKSGLIIKTIEEINEKAREYIDKYKDSWIINNPLEYTPFGNNTGYAYYNESDEDFSKLYHLFKSERRTISEKIKYQNEISRAEELLTYLTQGDEGEIIKLIYTDNQFNPFFHKLKPEALVSAIMKSSNRAISYFTYIIEERYTSGDTLNGQKACNYMKIEEGFWIEFQIRLSEKTPNISTLKNYFIEQLNMAIKKTITILSSVQN